MGIQTMGSNGVCGGGNGATQQPKSDGLGRQGSLYNLTLDEVQHQLGDLGKPLSSMNLDELLKSVWTAEANQGMSSGVPEYSEHGRLASSSSLPRQSSITFSTELTKKTVDQVWQDIQQGQKRTEEKKKKSAIDSNINEVSSSVEHLDMKACRETQNTLGEMTLEDFLVKAGIVVESSPGKKKEASVMGVEQLMLSQKNHDPQEAEWMNYQIPPIRQQHVFMPGHYQVQQPLPVTTNLVADMGHPETHMTMSSSPTTATPSDTHMSGRKRFASGDVMERTVERRQKRMIKNRESAARSRARKQAYTHELENKVSRLEEENERLKRQKEAEVLPNVPPPEPKYQLRRTTSASF